MFLGQG